MSAAVAFADLVAATLKADAGVGALVGDRIYDGRAGKRTAPYITLGVSDTVRDDFDCLPGRIEVLQVDCWTEDAGGRLWPARQLADAVVAALHEVEAEMGGAHALVSMRVVLHRVIGDPDGVTGHGIVQIEGLIEEAA